MTVEQIRMLMTDLGTRALAAAGQVAGQTLSPATIADLRRRFPVEMVSAALTLSRLRLRARERFIDADGMFFDGADLLEQATSEPVARHKAARFAGIDTVVDLCCGAGGDAIAIARHAGRVVGVDRSLASLVCLRANAANAGLADRVRQVAGNVGCWAPVAQAYHIDPPRRDDGRRLRMDQCGQWVELVESLTRPHRHVAGKLSPAIDPQALAWADEIEFISENGTLKQAVTWSGDLGRHRRSATVIRSLQGHTQGAETIASDTPERTAEAAGPLEPGRVLYEPDPAVVRAGLLGNLAERLGAAQVDPHLPLLVASRAGEKTLLARSYEVLEVLPWSIKPVKQLLRERSWHAAEVKTRAFACQPEEILAGLKGLKVPPGSPAVVLWAVRLGRKPVCILTRRLRDEGESRKGPSPSDG